MVQQLISGLDGSGVAKQIRNGKKSEGAGFDALLKGILQKTAAEKGFSGLRILKEGTAGRLKNELAARTQETRRLSRLKGGNLPDAEMLAAQLLNLTGKNIPAAGTENVKGDIRGDIAESGRNTRDKSAKPVDSLKGEREATTLLTSAVKDKTPEIKEPAGNDRDLKFTVEDRRNPFSKHTGNTQEKNSSGNGHDRKGEGALRESAANREPQVTEAVFSVNDVQDAKESAEAVTASRSRSSELLDRYLKVKGNEEIAKNIHFVVKDTGSGEIHLTLQPESLGKVRINLRLEENRIVGHVIVDSNQVKEIFLDNIQAISRMLEEQGYSQTSLDVSVDQRQMDQNGNREDGGKSYHQKYSERLKTAGETEALRARYPSSQGSLDLIA